MGYRDRLGYGKLRVDGEMQYVHRFVYELLVGAIPNGLVIDHLCRNPGCVDPDHLDVVTRRVNTLRGYDPPARRAVAIRCENGHPFDEANTYRWKGYRKCRACNGAAQRRRREKLG